MHVCCGLCFQVEISLSFFFNCKQDYTIARFIKPRDINECSEMIIYYIYNIPVECISSKITVCKCSIDLYSGHIHVAICFPKIICRIFRILNIGQIQPHSILRSFMWFICLIAKKLSYLRKYMVHIKWWIYQIRRKYQKI